MLRRTGLSFETMDKENHLKFMNSVDHLKNTRKHVKKKKKKKDGSIKAKHFSIVGWI